MNNAMSALAGIYDEQGMNTEARSIRATMGWETRRVRQVAPKDIIVHGLFTSTHLGLVLEALNAHGEASISTDNVDHTEEVLDIVGLTTEKGFKVTVSRLATEAEIEAYEASHC
jgi:hypothetical protein